MSAFQIDGVWFTERERFEAIRPDGSSANYSVGGPDTPIALRSIAEGNSIVRHIDTVREAEYMQVIRTAALGAADPEDAIRLMSADMTRFLNMTPDAGRPSDAARSAARSFESGQLTWDTHNAARSI